VPKADREDRDSSAPDHGCRKCLIDQHHRDVGDYRIHQLGLGTVEAFLHDGLLVAKMLAVFLESPEAPHRSPSLPRPATIAQPRPPAGALLGSLEDLLEPRRRPCGAPRPKPRCSSMNGLAQISL
jgi:hypothetical protein